MAEPDTRSPGRFLIWMIREQGSLFWFGVLVATIWMLPQTFTPWLVGRAIDDGIVAHDTRATTLWVALLGFVGLFGSASGVFFHTTIVREWLLSLYGTLRLVGAKSLQLGHVLSRRTPTGEVLSVGSDDADTFGEFIEILTRLISQVLAFVAVAVIVTGLSVKLGLLVLVSAPLLALLGYPLLGPMGRWQEKQRSRESELTSQATDIVAGLRILRGIGGEQTFGNNYNRQSARVRQAGTAAGNWQAGVDALGVALSGGFVVVLMILGVQEVVAGTLSVGALVSLLGYALFIQMPMRTFVEFAQKWTRGLVAARKTINVLGQPSPWHGSVTVPPATESPQLLYDETTGFVAEPGRLTMVVSADPDSSAALADRLGRYLPTTLATTVSDEIPEHLKGRAARRALAERARQRQLRAQADAAATAGDWGVRLGACDLARLPMDTVRERILVSEASPFVFAGPLRESVDPHQQLDEGQLQRVMSVAAGQDVLAAVPGGWDGHLDEKGRGLSGGQRQRLVLARALAADAEILVLVEPTSAVDAHTEAAIARRLPEHRRDRTTVVMTASPLLLHHADVVSLLVDGREAARATHADLVARDARYRAVVTRGDDA